MTRPCWTLDIRYDLGGGTHGEFAAFRQRLRRQRTRCTQGHVRRAPEAAQQETDVRVVGRCTQLPHPGRARREDHAGCGRRVGTLILGTLHVAELFEGVLAGARPRSRRFGTVSLRHESCRKQIAERRSTAPPSLVSDSGGDTPARVHESRNSPRPVRLSTGYPAESRAACASVRCGSRPPIGLRPRTGVLASYFLLSPRVALIFLTAGRALRLTATRIQRLSNEGPARRNSPEATPLSAPTGYA